eukprot:m.86476 g.86476  ORF g.86476 m.86476 type:complete len:66 (+) comp8762_c0_seq2:280-477(+)
MIDSYNNANKFIFTFGVVRSHFFHANDSSGYSDEVGWEEVANFLKTNYYLFTVIAFNTIVPLIHY